MIAAAISAPIKLHLFTSSVELISKLLIRTDAADMFENDDRVAEANEDTVGFNPFTLIEPWFKADRPGCEELWTEGLAEHIALRSFSMPSSIRISKSILLLSSSFYEFTHKKKENFFLEDRLSCNKLVLMVKRKRGH